MGSGETAPTMVKVHRLVAERISFATEGDAKNASSAPRSGARDRGAIGLLLDTPFGFQTNAEEISKRAVTYFDESVGVKIEVAGVRAAADLTSEHGHEIIARMVDLPLVFSGPGSPSYALRQWRGTLVPSVLSEKLELGGAVTFASAAALTLGSATVPVYEVYKVGEDPHWLEGLDLLRPMGLPAVLIPHYDNAEGRTHDTRYCYLGEERLSLMERELPEGTFVLGVDEHTALFIDFDSGDARVLGIGGATVRVRGRSARIEAGQTVALERVLELAAELASGSGQGEAVGAPSRSGSVDSRPVAEGAEGVSPNEPAPKSRSAPDPGAESAPDRMVASPLLDAVRAHESSFRSARAAGDAPGMVAAVLALEEELWAWRADTFQSDEMDRARASLRAMVSDLGRIAEVGARDPAELIGPYVDVALDLRNNARREERFAEADSVRERLELLGVDVHDTPDGSTWELRRENPSVSRTGS
ncbi:MAG TPA: hypothetical protein VMR97_04165 [Acidimicrobiales bacterium]|nr:hypothetical protein [Acidimicrobiales bacterium]